MYQLLLLVLLCGVSGWAGFIFFITNLWAGFICFCEAGYIVGMSSCYPQPGSVKINDRRL